MARFSLIPSKQGTFHNTHKHALFNGRLALVGNGAFALIDVGFSINGFYQTFQIIRPTGNWKIDLAYLGLGVACAALVALQIRHGVLRLSPYYASIRKMRQSPKLGNIADEPADAEMISVQQIISDGMLILAWAITIITNINGLSWFWPTVSAAFAAKPSFSTLGLAALTAFIIGALSIAFPYQGHVGEAAAFHWLEEAARMKLQEIASLGGVIQIRDKKAPPTLKGPGGNTP